MNALKSPSPAVDLAPVRVLAALLERLDNSQIPVDPAQYRSVVLHLEGAFRALPGSVGLGDLLSSHPSAAQVYENLNYAHAGLVRSPLEASLAAEGLARSAIQRAKSPPKEGITDGQG